MVSGLGSGDPGDALTFTVEVQEDGSAASGKTVTFSVSPDDGTVSLSTKSTTTGSNGQASTTLSTGSGSSGSYTVTASVGDSSVSGTATVETSPPPPGLAIIVVSGPGSGNPGDALTFIVEVQEDGSAASGKTVTFSITSGDGNASLNPTSATTGSNGRAQTTLTLGNSASGSYTITATVGSKSESGTATVETTPSPPPSSDYYPWVISSLGSGAPGDTLTLIVEVRGEDENPVPGQTVTFSILSGDGNASLSTTSATTGSNGQASTTLTLGNSASGSYNVKASISNHLFATSYATVNTPPPPPPELSISVVSGPGSGEPGDALTFIVEVQEDGSAASGKTVTFSITSGDGNASLNPTSATTGSNGRASTSVTLGDSATGSYTITATVGTKSTSGTATVNTPSPPLHTLVMSHSPWPLDPGGSMTFTVTVKDDGSPAQDQTVTFSVSPDDGTVSLSTKSTTTGSNGQASTTLSTGSGSSGSYTVTASVGTSSLSSTVTVETSTSEQQQQEEEKEEGQQSSQQRQEDSSDDGSSDDDLPPPPTPTSLEVISGDSQTDLTGEVLANPFVVEVRDQYDAPMDGVAVTFFVVTGGGSLSDTSVNTNANGLAQSTLTLGLNAGINSVMVTVSGIEEQLTINAEGIRTPLAFWIIYGNKQQGLVSEALALPFLVEVRDRSGEPFPEAEVTFLVTSGGGSLSATRATTDNSGRAESTLTLGPEPGTNTVEVAVTGIEGIQTVTAIAESPALPQDVNRDDVVNILDLVLVASALGTEGAGLVEDVNRDGVVNILDLVLVAAARGDVSAAPSSDPQALELLTAAAVREWLVQAGELDLTDSTSREGALFLDKLLRALTPKETTLLTNYPNPFNPETWIPYGLANDTNVQIAIYDISGALVRQLNLGHQRAGNYTQRSRAAYWDGSNGIGEHVASGVYFYTLTAGDFTATRKMLVGK